MGLFESDIVSNSIKLHVYRTGTNKPPLVFAHGRSDNGLCYWPVAKQLAGDYEIILYDARDHGRSEKPELRTSLMDRVGDLAGLLEALGLDEPKLVGHSLGAVTVALLAGSYPDIPGCIVLEDPPTIAALAEDDEQARVRYQGWEAYIGAAKERSVPDLIEMSRRDNPTWPEDEREPWAQSKLQYHFKPFGEDRIDAALGDRILSRISCPVLLITADLALGSAFPPQDADELVSGLPNARHVNISGAGHNIRRERPEAYLTAVRDFLNSCEP